MVENIPNIGKNRSRSTRPKESPICWTQLGPHQDILQFNCQKLVKARILKAAWEKREVIYKGIFIRLLVDFLTTHFRPGKNGITYFKYWEEKKPCQWRHLYPTKLPFRNEGERKTFLNKQKLSSSPLDHHYKNCLREFF